MTKKFTNNTTLQELWAIKDDTAERFKSVADYFAHLRTITKVSPGQAESVVKKRSAIRRYKAVSAPAA